MWSVFKLLPLTQLTSGVSAEVHAHSENNNKDHLMLLNDLIYSHPVFRNVEKDSFWLFVGDVMVTRHIFSKKNRKLVETGPV